MSTILIESDNKEAIFQWMIPKAIFIEKRESVKEDYRQVPKLNKETFIKFGIEVFKMLDESIIETITELAHQKELDQDESKFQEW